MLMRFISSIKSVQLATLGLIQQQTQSFVFQAYLFRFWRIQISTKYYVNGPHIKSYYKTLGLIPLYRDGWFSFPSNEQQINSGHITAMRRHNPEIHSFDATIISENSLHQILVQNSTTEWNKLFARAWDLGTNNIKHVQ